MPVQYTEHISASTLYANIANTRIASPAVNHEFIDAPWTARGWGKTRSFTNNLYALQVCVLFKWFVSETPYLIHDTAKAPHVTGSGVLLVVECLYE